MVTHHTKIHVTIPKSMSPYQNLVHHTKPRKPRSSWGSANLTILYQLRFMALVFAIIYISNVVIQVEIILIMTIFVIALLGNSHPLRDIK